MQNPQNNKIEEILNSLDGIQRAEPRPFLYTRVMARLEKKESFWERITSFISRPAIAIAGVVLILLVNGYFLTQTDSPVITNQEEQTAAVDETEGFDFAVATLYDDEN